MTIEYLLVRLRNWLLLRLAGGCTIAINCEIDGGTLFIRKGHALVSNLNSRNANPAVHVDWP